MSNLDYLVFEQEPRFCNCCRITVEVPDIGRSRYVSAFVHEIEPVLGHDLFAPYCLIAEASAARQSGSRPLFQRNFGPEVDIHEHERFSRFAVFVTWR